MSEAEGFIHAAADAYDVQQIDKGDECYKAIYTCKTCGSVFLCLWSDFSISLNRSCLKPITLKAEPVGAEPQKPIPFYVGIFGYSYPERSDFRQVGYESFRDYIYALKAR